MRAFIAAVVLLSVLLTGTIVGSIFLSSSTRSMLENAERLSKANQRGEELAAFDEAWTRRRPLYMLAISTNEIGRVDEALAEAIASHESKSDSDYAIAVAELREACSHIHDLVGFRIEQIF